MAIEAISTGAMSLDLALGIGGLPRGRIVEIFGPESSGKSTLALHVVAEAQRNGGICAYIDAEHAMDPVYAKAIGVDIDELLISQPDTGEQALEIADMLIRSGAIDVIVIDSVAALTPRAEIEGDMGDTPRRPAGPPHVPGAAQADRRRSASRSTIAIFINQLREKIGVIYGSPGGDPGGRALKFYSSVRLDIRRVESIKDGAEMVGNRTRVKVVKNKCAPPFRTAEFDIMYGKGISREGSILDVAVDLGIVKKSGAWYTYEGEQLGQGRENAKQFLRESPELMVELDERIRQEVAARRRRRRPPRGGRGRRRADLARGLTVRIHSQLVMRQAVSWSLRRDQRTGPGRALLVAKSGRRDGPQRQLGIVVCLNSLSSGCSASRPTTSSVVAIARRRPRPGGSSAGRRRRGRRRRRSARRRRRARRPSASCSALNVAYGQPSSELLEDADRRRRRRVGAPCATTPRREDPRRHRDARRTATGDHVWNSFREAVAHDDPGCDRQELGALARVVPDARVALFDVDLTEREGDEAHVVVSPRLQAATTCSLALRANGQR